MQEVKGTAIPHQKSEQYYTRAYELAKARNLSKARVYLEKAIYLNKNHQEAKNLMGLICFEMGEVGLALKYWILSTSLCKEDNLANRYIDEVQHSQKTFEAYKQALKGYNQAIEYTRQRNIDVAIIRLKKSIRLNPRLVEARNLLAFIYITQEEHDLAMSQIKEVLKIDALNEKAMHYLVMIENPATNEEVAKQHTVSKINKESAYIAGASHVGIDRRKYFIKQLGCFLIGIVCMFLATYYVILPSKVLEYEKQINTLTHANGDIQQELSGLEATYQTEKETSERIHQELTEANKALQGEVQAYEMETKLAQCKSNLDKQNWTEAAESLYQIDENILDEAQKERYHEYKERSYARAGDVFYQRALQDFWAGNNEVADEQFEKTIRYTTTQTTAANALYYRGEIAEKSNDIDQALKYYKSVITSYAQTSAATKAQNRIATLE